MRRDLELTRLILLEVEGEMPVDLSSYSDDELNFHKALIKEAGLAEGVVSYSTAKDARPDMPDLAILMRLTSDGHDFIDKAKNETIWAKAKETIQEKGATLSIEAMKIALSEVVRLVMR
jgi:hypothetical protein